MSLILTVRSIISNTCLVNRCNTEYISTDICDDIFAFCPLIQSPLYTNRIVILSPFLLSLLLWRLRRWMWRSCLLLTIRDQESQRILCGGRGWAMLAFQRWSYPWKNYLQSHVSDTLLACVRDVFNGSLKSCFGPPRSLLPLANSPNRSQKERILDMWLTKQRRCWRNYRCTFRLISIEDIDQTSVPSSFVITLMKYINLIIPTTV